MAEVEPRDGRRESNKWGEAHAAREEANALAAKAAEAAARASALEAQATSGDEGVEHSPADPSAGTWEGSVSGGAAPEQKEYEEVEEQS